MSFMRRGTEIDGEKPERGEASFEDKEEPETTVSVELGLHSSAACHIDEQCPMDQRTNRNNHSGAFRCGHRPFGSGAAEGYADTDELGERHHSNLHTDQGGRYSFNQLPPSAYSLINQSERIRDVSTERNLLDAAETATQDVRLTIGSETVSVSVTSDVSL